MKMKKRVAPMWLADNALFHISDYERAKRHNDKTILVYVGVDIDYFIGTWQFTNGFKDWIFKSENEAIKK